MNLYFISGLGADERIFQRLLLPGDFTVIHIEWPQLDTDETLQTYSFKISKQIDTSQDFALIGVSFGGLVAIELMKVVNPASAIIISSVATKKEIPYMYRLLGMSGLIKLVPKFALNKVYPFTYWFFGVSDPSDKKLLKQIVSDTSPGFLKWALNEIFVWTNRVKPEGVYHIHGRADRLFPSWLTRADVLVKNGGHLMVYTDAGTISSLIQENLGSR